VCEENRKMQKENENRSGDVLYSNSRLVFKENTKENVYFMFIYHEDAKLPTDVLCHDILFPLENSF